MAARYEISKTKSGKFHFVLKAGNSQVILTSQQYADRASAIGGINSCKSNGKKAAMFDKKSAKNGQPYFALMASNGQVIGNSQMYSSTDSRARGVRSVMNNAGAPTKDLTA